MRFETLLFAKEGAIATVTLNRPEVLNAITPKLLEELLSALSRIAAETEVRVVVLTGAGRAFSAGVDLTALKGHRLENGSVGSVLDEPARAVIRLIRSSARSSSWGTCTSRTRARRTRGEPWRGSSPEAPAPKWC
jgi:enoyl-CoA hydratase/carnithine racemase